VLVTYACYTSSRNEGFLCAVEWIDLKYDVLTSINITDCATFIKYSDDLPFYRNVLNEGILLSA